MRRLLALVVLCTLPLIFLAATAKPDAPTLVIRVALPPTDTCYVSYDDGTDTSEGSTDWVGQVYMAAPCQTTSGHYSCWKEPEDDCIGIDDVSFTPVVGWPCDLDHCQFSILATITFYEHCDTSPCSNDPCCASGDLTITSGSETIGTTSGDGDADDVEAYGELACKSTSDTSGLLMIDVDCDGTGELLSFGKAWKCLKCDV